MNYSSYNTASTFTTKLNETIELDGSWEVGFIEASFPADVENVPDNSFYYDVYFTDQHSSTVVLPRGVYGSVRVVLITLLAQQRKTLNLQGSNAKIILRKESVTNHITLKISDTATDVVGVRFSNNLAHMLGFAANRTYDGHEIYTSEHPVSLYEGLNLVYVYCDLLEQVLVGDTKAPLLRIINRTTLTKFNAVSHATFNPIQYIPLQKKYFDTIAIKLMTDVGERMPFVVVKSILVIEFRRCADPYLLL